MLPLPSPLLPLRPLRSYKSPSPKRARARDDLLAFASAHVRRSRSSQSISEHIDLEILYRSNFHRHFDTWQFLRVLTRKDLTPTQVTFPQFPPLFLWCSN